MAIRVYRTNNVVRVSAPGPQGAAGAAGVGVPAGGTTGQVLAKASDTAYDTEWVTGGGGGGVSDHGLLTGLADDDHAQYSLANGTRWTATMTASRAVASDGAGALVVSAVTAAELGYLSGVTSAVQTQLNAKAASSHAHAWGDITSGVPTTLAGYGITDAAALVHTHAAGDIASGTLADARVAASNVTQHQAAIAITESQISDLGTYLEDITGEPLGDLSDVTITAIAAGELLAWDGAAWINRTIAEAGLAAASHTHASTAITDFEEAVEDVVGGLLVGGSGITVSYNDGAGTLTITNAAAGTFPSLTQLTDVTITTPAGGQFLRYDGAEWVNAAISSGDLPSHNHAASEITSGTVATARLGSGTADSSTFLRGDQTWATPGGGGTVTSVGLSLPAELSVSGSPVTGSGTLTATWATQAANAVLAGPTSGGAATPAFRALVAADVPSLDAAKITTGTLTHERGGLEADVSAYSGLVKITGGATSAVTITAAGEALLDDANAAAQLATLGAAAASHAHSAADITSGTLDDARLDFRQDLGATFDGGGSAVASGVVVLIPVERSGVIKAASLVGDASGSITITAKKYTPAAGALGSATTLGTVALSSAQHNRDTTLAGWTTSLAAGDVLELTTGGTIATVTRVTCRLKIEEA